MRVSPYVPHPHRIHRDGISRSRDRIPFICERRLGCGASKITRDLAPAPAWSRGNEVLVREGFNRTPDGPCPTGCRFSARERFTKRLTVKIIQAVTWRTKGLQISSGWTA
jgi:hypothetical protein